MNAKIEVEVDVEVEVEVEGIWTPVVPTYLTFVSSGTMQYHCRISFFFSSPSWTIILGIVQVGGTFCGRMHWLTACLPLLARLFSL